MITAIDALLSGLIVAFASLLPMSPEGEPFSSLVNGYSYLLVPAYLGVAFGIMFYFREEFSHFSLEALKRVYGAPLKFITFATLFTVLVGYPLWRFSCDVPPRVSFLLNALIGALIVLTALRPDLHPLKGLDGRLPEEPSLVDSLSAGIAQGLALLGCPSRTGLTILALFLPSHNPRKVLEWSFWVAPAYIILRLILLGPWKSPDSMWIPFAASISAFATSILLIKALLLLAERKGRVIFAFLGAITLVVYSLEVML